MNNDKKEKFFKKLVERTLKLDAERKSEQKKQQELADHISVLEKMTSLEKSKIKAIANAIILENEKEGHSQQKKILATNKSKYCFAMSLIIIFVVIILMLMPTANELEPEIVVVQPENKAITPHIPPTEEPPKLKDIEQYINEIENKMYETTYKPELPRPKDLEYEITEVEKKSLKIKPVTMGTTKTWGDDLNPTNEIPLNSFKAFYINTNNKKQVIATSHVKQVAIEYSYSDLHDIHSQNFGAYWVGMFEFTEDQALHFNVHLSWASTRIIVDGFVVYEGGSKTRVPYLFTKGKHKIEVEYTNNWHTTDFRAILE